VAAAGLSERLRFVAGDFLVEELPDAEVLVSGHVLHDWGLDTKRLLIGKAYRALPPQGAACQIVAQPILYRLAHAVQGGRSSHNPWIAEQRQRPGSPSVIAGLARAEPVLDVSHP